MDWYFLVGAAYSFEKPFSARLFTLTISTGKVAF
jgi:hypothetical protein